MVAIPRRVLLGFPLWDAENSAYKIKVSQSPEGSYSDFHCYCFTRMRRKAALCRNPPKGPTRISTEAQQPEAHPEIIMSQSPEGSYSDFHCCLSNRLTGKGLDSPIR